MSSATNRGMKAEPEFIDLSPVDELEHLRTRVWELENEKAAVEAENRRLKDMLVHEIPSLLSTMKQNLYRSGRRLISCDFAPGGERVTNGGGSFPHPSTSEELPVPGGALALDTGDYVSPEDVGSPLCPVVTTEDPTCPGSLCSSADIPFTCDLVAQHALRHCIGPIVRHVEVFPTSGVLCEAQAWHSALQAPSPTAMARTLLLGVFDMETLLHSNLRGGRSRRPSFPNHRVGLDPHKLDAIYNATLARFPLARKGQIGTGINSKLSEIRFRSRRANPEKRYL